MAHATVDCLSAITADMQDPSELMVQMYAYWQQGYKLAIGNRQDREETGLAVTMAKLFHWLMKNMALSNIPDGGFRVLQPLGGHRGAEAARTQL